MIASLPLRIRRLNAIALTLTLAPLIAAACTAGSPAAGGAGTGGSAGTGGDSHGDASPDVALTPFEQQALEIAATYQSWGRVDDELRWAPFLCRIPLPGRAYVSGSDDGTTHGQKLYSVFAKHRDRYPDGPHDDQVVVKQSWKIEAVTTPDASYRPEDFRAPAGEDAGSDHFYPYATRDGVLYRATEPAGLFIMFRLDAATPDTDQGWVYATVSTAGTVTAAGRVASCMGCHEISATHERLYGVQVAPKQ